jgi:glutaredoxin
MHLVRSHVISGLIGLAVAGLFAPQAGAQQVYRIVGPDGRVTFSDKPPLETSARAAPTVPLSSGGASTASLPFELRQIAGKYPVTLYTGSNCGPCGAGRAFLSSRGIPFAERTVNTAEDVEALQRMAGDNSLPLLTIGGQQIKGYSDNEWGQFLDAAGYPHSSALPGSYRNPAPAPLVAVQRPAAANPDNRAAAPAAGDGEPVINPRRIGNAPGRSAAPSAPANENPPGIQF